MPCCHADPDSFVGVALLKDLLAPIAGGDRGAPITRYARKPAFIPETKPILDLLTEMRSSHNHMVVVVDEHGGTAGLVTIEDIVEAIIGEIVDEYDRDDRYINDIGDGVGRVDGRRGRGHGLLRRGLARQVRPLRRVPDGKRVGGGAVDVAVGDRADPLPRRIEPDHHGRLSRHRGESRATSPPQQCGEQEQPHRGSSRHLPRGVEVRHRP